MDINNPEFYYTYTPGYDLIYDKPVTSHSIVQLCVLLKQHFGEEYYFSPERIMEGGILVEQRGVKGYKSLRFHDLKWPIIEGIKPDEILTELKTEPEVILCQPSKVRHPTILKAFYGAPCWTSAELQGFKDAFASIGIRTVFRPCDRYFNQVGTLGRPNVKYN